MSKLRTHYDNLKVSRDAPDFVIRAAYKTLSQKYHPDKHPGDERAGRVMAIINSSYEVLSDPERRADHDAWIAREEARAARSQAAQQGGAPIPPQWRQSAPAPEKADTTKRQGAFVGLVLLLVSPIVAILKSFPQLLFLGLIVGGIFLWDRFGPKSPPPAGPKPYQAQAPVQPEPVKTNTPANTAVRYAKPVAAPNGNPWPTKAAYVKGYPIANDEGYSKVTVDNGQNDSDVFVKLVSLDDSTAYPVRQFFIPAHSRFTLNKVTAGRYDVRYRDLDRGGLSRSEAFDVEQVRTADGVQFSDITLTLYKVQDGNFQTYDLADSEF